VDSISLDQLEFESGWPQDKVTIGQVGGVATDTSGNVYIFHRGSRAWDAWSVFSYLFKCLFIFIYLFIYFLGEELSFCHFTFNF
jgi:hypothetical protein